jgi:RecG-like helicase
VLAQQHYNTFSERLKAYPVKVEMLSRFRTGAQQQRIVGDLRDGQVDIIIGTHRLFSDDISFKDLGLLIIDEEQRFGVNHKEILKQLRTEVDVLTMTATPIPRTLYMSLTGVRDISQIDTAPSDRMPVQTFVGEAEDFLLRRAILRELDRGGQIFYVHNRVQSIENGSGSCDAAAAPATRSQGPRLAGSPGHTAPSLPAPAGAWPRFRRRTRLRRCHRPGCRACSETPSDYAKSQSLPGRSPKGEGGACPP